MVGGSHAAVPGTHNAYLASTLDILATFRAELQAELSYVDILQPSHMPRRSHCGSCSHEPSSNGRLSSSGAGVHRQCSNRRHSSSGSPLQRQSSGGHLR